MNLMELVGRLIDDVPVTVHGTTRSTPSLLVQLREAIFQSHEPGCGSSGFASRTPLAAGAFTLFDKIEHEAAALYVGIAHSLDHQGREQGLLGVFWHNDEPSELTAKVAELFTRDRPRVFPLGLSQAIHDWAAELDGEAAAVAAEIVAGWIEQIEVCLGMKHRMDYFGIPDPDTGSTTVWEGDVLKTALYGEVVDGVPLVHSRATGRVWSTQAEIDQLRFGVARPA